MVTQGRDPIIEDPRARLERVFDLYSITDDHCMEPYIPTCNIHRAVKRMLSVHAPTAVVNKFLDEEVETSETRRVTISAFELLCALCQSKGAGASNDEAAGATKAILQGKSSVSLSELREYLQGSIQHCDDGLSDAEIDLLIAEISRRQTDESPSVSAEFIESILTRSGTFIKPATTSTAPPTTHSNHAECSAPSPAPVSERPPTPPLVPTASQKRSSPSPAQPAPIVPPAPAAQSVAAQQGSQPKQNPEPDRRVTQSKPEKEMKDSSKCCSVM